ncbi:hypothetical protein [Virgibacillus dakarensis]|nr:hypothetical protein [Virgibacillus dakarensis]
MTVADLIAIYENGKEYEQHPLKTELINGTILYAISIAMKEQKE